MIKSATFHTASIKVMARKVKAPLENKNANGNPEPKYIILPIH